MQAARLSLAAFALLSGASTASAFTEPFRFHCRGNACRAVTFLDEGVGCTVVTNQSRYPVHITQGVNQLSFDIQPGETHGALNGERCYGYYDGGETATFLAPRR